MELKRLEPTQEIFVEKLHEFLKTSMSVNGAVGNSKLLNDLGVTFSEFVELVESAYKLKKYVKDGHTSKIFNYLLNGNSIIYFSTSTNELRSFRWVQYNGKSIAMSGFSDNVHYP